MTKSSAHEPTATTAGVETRSIVIEKEMSYPAEKIWRAITDSGLIKEWLMENDFQPLRGHRFNFSATPMPHWNGITDCEVIELEPHKRLSYTWNSSGAEAANGLKTLVQWTLTPTKKGTRVRMEQSGFRADQENNYRGAMYGWNKFMGGLEHTVAQMK